MDLSTFKGTKSLTGVKYDKNFINPIQVFDESSDRNLDKPPHMVNFSF